MTCTTWIQSLEQHLSGMSRTDRNLILRDVHEIAREIGEGKLQEVLGEPEEYARQAIQALSPEPEPDAPQARIGPAHVEFRGPLQSSVRSRIWDPTNPNILTSHLFGIGWGINFGAVAVRLRLIRPDDYDEATIQAIPQTVTTLSTGFPAVLAAVIAGTNVQGLLTHRGSRNTICRVFNLAVTVSTIAWSRGAKPQTKDALIRNAIATGITVAALANTRATDVGKKAGGSSALVAAVLVFLQLVVPVRVGLNSLWNAKESIRETS